MWINDALKNNKKILALAPMADMTDSPYCKIVRDIAGPDLVIFREMVSSEAIVRDNAKTLKMCEFTEMERPIVTQVFGANPKTITDAAKMIVDKYHPGGIDINMGCPVPKIAGKAECGAALIKDYERAVRIVKALKKANLGLPISVKTRLGWEEDDEILKFAPKLVEAGLDLITIHGRTRAQSYSGKANWDMIAKVKKLLSIPVIANGDILNGQDIKKCLEVTGADGVIIGRGALGNPWVFKRGVDGILDCIPSLDELKDVVLKHAELHLEHYGERGMVTFRKHLAYYFKGARVVGLKDVKELRMKLVRVSTLDELKTILESF